MISNMTSLIFESFYLRVLFLPLKKKNPVPFKLQEGEVRIISLEQCQSYFDMKTITNRMICAGYESGTVDSCMVSCLCLPKRFNSAIGSVGPYTHLERKTRSWTQA